MDLFNKGDVVDMVKLHPAYSTSRVARLPSGPGDRRDHLAEDPTCL